MKCTMLYHSAAMISTYRRPTIKMKKESNRNSVICSRTFAVSWRHLRIRLDTQRRLTKWGHRLFCFPSPHAPRPRPPGPPYRLYSQTKKTVLCCPPIPNSSDRSPIHDSRVSYLQQFYPSQHFCLRCVLVSARSVVCPFVPRPLDRPQSPLRGIFASVGLSFPLLCPTTPTASLRRSRLLLSGSDYIDGFVDGLPLPRDSDGHTRRQRQCYSRTLHPTDRILHRHGPTTTDSAVPV